jgi:ribose transport system substrate-binding protein
VTIQPLPEDAARAAANEPGINCAKCDAPPGLYHLTKTKAFDAQ